MSMEETVGNDPLIQSLSSSRRKNLKFSIIRFVIGGLALIAFIVIFHVYLDSNTALLLTFPAMIVAIVLNERAELRSEVRDQKLQIEILARRLSILEDSRES